MYTDVPEPGFVTGFTYGLSPFRRANAQTPARELCITMRSTDPAWARVPALTVAALRGLCPFDAGMVIGYKKPYVPPSDLSSLVLASAPPPLALAGPVDVTTPGAGTQDLIEIVGAYPVYPSERTAVHADGLGVLFDSTWDPYDPGRRTVV
nr:suppressor of fused domain protein [Streptomyces akebiae]